MLLGRQRKGDDVTRRVAVDFDGTLHPYSKGWTGPEPDDEPPFPGAEDFLLGLLTDGYDVVIFSTRADHPDGKQGIIRWLHKHMPPIFTAMRDGVLPGQVWSERREGRVRISHEKPAAVAYVDDRAVPFVNGDYAAARAAVDRLAAGRPHGAGDAAWSPRRASAGGVTWLPVDPDWLCAFIGPGVGEADALQLPGQMYWRRDELHAMEVVTRRVADAQADGWLPADLRFQVTAS